MIRVKLLHPDARLPTVHHRGEDLGYDLYAIEDVVLPPGVPIKVRTGIAVQGPPGMGFILGDRSSMAARGITYAGGRIDAGYRGEILVCLINLNQPRYSLSVQSAPDGNLRHAELLTSDVSVHLHAGDKIAQMSLFQAMTHMELDLVEQLDPSPREAGGFGSSGR